jgi:hypothetical protein
MGGVAKTKNRKQNSLIDAPWSPQTSPEQVRPFLFFELSFFPIIYSNSHVPRSFEE